MTTIPRNIFHENTLCKAIQGNNVIELTYQDDAFARTFEPYVVFEEHATKNINLAGRQRFNPNKPADPLEWKKFTVGLIENLKVFSRTFSPDPVFSSFDRKIYGFNVLCAVDR